MSQLGEFLATIQKQQDAHTAELEARLAELESKEECGCAETISALEERLAAIESKEECGCAETITALEQRLATLEAKEECGCAETITALEERLATLESKEECGCGSYDELLASYEERISALEGNTGGGNTEGEGGDSGSTEGGEEGGNTEGEGGEEGGSTEPIPARQALEEYDHLICFVVDFTNSCYLTYMSLNDYNYAQNGLCIGASLKNTSVYSRLLCDTRDIVKVYTPDLQEIEIIADSTLIYSLQKKMSQVFSIAFGNKATKEVYCYQVDCANKTISPCTDEAFIAQWGNSDALKL